MIVDLVFIAAVVGLLIAIYKLKFSKASIQREVEEATQQNRQLQQVIETKKDEAKLEEQPSTTVEEENPGWQGDDSDSGEEEEAQMDERKQMKKEIKQKEKQQRKEAQEEYLKYQQDKRDKYEKEVEERERLQEEKRKKEEQILEQLREEERKRKEEEFNKWKDMFSVEETGKEKLSADEQKRKIEAFNAQFIAVLKRNKLSLLEDLSHKFKLSTKELVEKIKQLEQEHAISGIFDERGKYLVIEQGEWSAIKNYISARGRVKKTDIMTECAKLIKIPDNVEQDLLALVKDEPSV